MRTINDNQETSCNDPAWYFLAEYPLNELLVDKDFRDKSDAGLLFHTIRELGISVEQLNKIERTLLGFANEVMAHHFQGGSESTVYIRLFYHKMAIDDVNLAKTLHPMIGEQSEEPAPIIRHPKTEMNGGWGYFLIERSGGFMPSSSMIIRNLVDLYLYKEGE